MFAAVGIIVPVIIHFWNRKQGKTLKVGSIALLTESYKQQAKNIQLQDRLLLLLRSLLVLLLAFLLSQPVWKKQLNPEKEKGWVLMERQDLKESYAAFQTVIDSLIGQKYEFHFFDGQFKKTELAEALKENSDSLLTSNLSYWSLLSSLDQQVPAKLPVYLFTTNGLNRFTGKRPEVAMKLQWHTYTPKDSVSEWLAKAYMTARDSVRLVTATSGPFGTSYSFKAAPFTGINLPQGNRVPVSYPENKEVLVDTATLKLTIYTDKYFKDASYVKAAVEAIKQYSKRKISLSVLNKTGDMQPGQDWLFWLSDQPLPALEAKNILKYETGKPESVGTFIALATGGNGDEYLPLYKRIMYQPDVKNAGTIWKDGFGKPLLSRERGARTVYHFYSRFDPSWNDLAWHNAFPRLIFQLIYSNRAEIDGPDNRIMDEEQALPVFSSAPKATDKEKFVETFDLSQAFWLVALLLFFIERIISFRTKMQKANA